MFILKVVNQILIEIKVMFLLNSAVIQNSFGILVIRNINWERRYVNLMRIRRKSK